MMRIKTVLIKNDVEKFDKEVAAVIKRSGSKSTQTHVFMKGDDIIFVAIIYIPEAQ
jgi:hypothetical protein